ncbi:WG repeat-containing protein [Cecembia lonarensis]|uniref:KWG Leptospira n=1 Tax=Cecembia lonarensis (strain CCUG 58316 / KCTC 22772 / LW9) TaxID=1225176 RepID=K1KZ20_CECL9|nr:WG repeat-containing protein [Cecembia lonarensis]EKB49425.1 KWG Leptospira [Cecembia lonarensis LW9]
MKQKWCVGAALLAALSISVNTQTVGQTYEVYDQNLKLKSRLEFDQIAILSESVRISTANNEVKLLSKEYKPFIDLNGEKVYFYDQPWIIVKGRDGLGAFHEYGEEILLGEYDEIQTFFTRLLGRKGNQYWIYDHSNRETIFLGTFEKATLAINGQVIAQTAQGYFLPLSDNPDKLYDKLEQINENFIISKESTGYGMINREGNYVLQPVIDHIVHLEEDYFYAYDGNQYMLIKGREGKANISYSSYHKITLEDGVMLEYIHGKLRRVMKNDGILLDQVGMEKVKGVGEKHYNVWMRDNKLGLLGQQGWEVNPVADVEKILPGNEGLYPALKGGKYGFIDKSGKWVVPAQFDEVKKFNEGLASYRLNGQWGILDRQGQIISPAQFNSVSDFRRGLAVVRLGNRQNILDRQGSLLLENGYERISLGTDNYFISEDNGKFGLIAPDGKEIVSPKYEELRREDLNRILVRVGDKYGLMDENGDYLLPIYYKSIVFDQGARQILAEDDYQFVQVEQENTGRRKRSGG